MNTNYKHMSHELILNKILFVKQISKYYLHLNVINTPTYHNICKYQTIIVNADISYGYTLHSYSSLPEFFLKVPVVN